MNLKTLAVMVLLLAITNFYSYGLGQKHIHVVYAEEYYEPTQKLFQYFKELVDDNKLETIVSDIKGTNSELNKISWRDEGSFKLLVDKIITR